MDKFELVDKNPPRSQRIMSVRLDDEDFKKLHYYAKKEGMNLHRFIKSIINGYLVYREKEAKR